jgi:hypothetical protein
MGEKEIFFCFSSRCSWYETEHSVIFSQGPPVSLCPESDKSTEHCNAVYNIILSCQMVDSRHVFQLEMLTPFSFALCCVTFTAHLILLGSTICCVRYTFCPCHKICFVTGNEVYREIIMAVQSEHMLTIS